MSEIPRILDQLHRAFEGSAWHGENVVSILKGVSAVQAARKPLMPAHSIWELVLHMTTWKRVVRERIEGNVRDVSPAEDWQTVTDISEVAWENAIQGLVLAHRQLYDVVARLDETRLSEQPGPRSNTYYVQIHGVIQHDLYHAGQIAVLKKSFAQTTRAAAPEPQPVIQAIRHPEPPAPPVVAPAPRPVEPIITRPEPPAPPVVAPEPQPVEQIITRPEPPDPPVIAPEPQTVDNPLRKSAPPVSRSRRPLPASAAATVAASPSAPVSAPAPAPARVERKLAGTMSIRSSAFVEGKRIPKDHTCDGSDLSPPLEWGGVPAGTKSLAIICDDVDAPMGTFTHWLLWGLAPDATRLEKGVRLDTPLPGGGRQGLNSLHHIGYRGPCPPPGNPHRYYFKLYALDALINPPDAADKGALERAMEGHVLDMAQLMGRYGR